MARQMVNGLGTTSLPEWIIPGRSFQENSTGLRYQEPSPYRFFIAIVLPSLGSDKPANLHRVQPCRLRLLCPLFTAGGCRASTVRGE